MRKVTRKQALCLGEALYAESQGLKGVFSCSILPRKVMESLVSEAAMSRIQLVVCDGDGFAKEPERCRMGYALTPRGRALAKALYQLEEGG